jgi:hypothetical protein
LIVKPPSGLVDFTAVLSVLFASSRGEGGKPNVNSFRVSVAPSANSLVDTCQLGINPMIRQTTPTLIEHRRNHFMIGLSMFDMGART